MRSWVLAVTLALHGFNLPLVQAKAVFAHYMVGTVTEEHAQQDVSDAIAMGLDGFALNIGDPTASYTADTLEYLFNSAKGTVFKLFISMDLWASGDVCYTEDLACDGPFSFNDLLNQYTSSDAYYRAGPNNYPLISTFSDGGFYNSNWSEWRSSLSNELYLVPDFDGTLGYYENNGGWWEYWGDIVDGLFSWEAAWPERAGLGGAFPGDVGPDKIVMEGTVANGKSYMIALSPLQYKNAYETNLYRAGDLNLVKRMTNILEMTPQPDFVEIISWNDGPESHYIGNLWPEQNTDYQPGIYATQDYAPHTGWQSIISPFIKAFKSGGTVKDMVPGTGTISGALWYKTILQDIYACEELDYYTQLPEGYSNGTDQLHWAISASSSMVGYSVKVWSDNLLLQTQTLQLGLNSNSAGTAQAGVQRLEVLDAAGNIVQTAQGPYCLTYGCPQSIYNMNYQVVPLSTEQTLLDCNVPEPNVNDTLMAEVDQFLAALQDAGYANFTGNLSDAGTRLWGYDGCDGGQRIAIDSGWAQSWKITNLLYDEAKAGINFNEASAVEYLGPPALNGDQQQALNDLFINLGWIQPNGVPYPFRWRLHVRCDDPNKRCSCGSDGPIAYTTNKDAESLIARINFCPKYFSLNNLDTAMKLGMNPPETEPNDKFNLYSYLPNKAATWIHELLHIDWVAQSGTYGSNLQIEDVLLSFKRNDGTLYNTRAYGPGFCKSLARWGVSPGYWVIRNADSLTMYALARYVQKALGNVYPHLPLAGNPPRSLSIPLGRYEVVEDLFSIDGVGYTTVINQTEFTLLEYDASCVNIDDEDESLNEKISPTLAYEVGVAVESDFPADYLALLATWQS